MRKKKLIIYNPSIKYTKKAGTEDIEYLSSKAFHPNVPFFIENDFIQEWYSVVTVVGVLENTRFLRETLKKIDALLEVNGVLVIYYYINSNSWYTGGKQCYIRPFSFLLYEINISLRERFHLESNEKKGQYVKLVYKKRKRMLPENDSLDKWSFGIISNGEKNYRIIKTINQIRKFNIPSYEIIICGPSIAEVIERDVIFVDDSDLRDELSAPIALKKNRIIDKALYNNLVIIHDRISFSEEWYSQIVKYGNCFEFLSTQVLDENTKSYRVQDWMYYQGDFTDYKKNKGGGLKYDEWNMNVYQDGGYLICKNHLMKQIYYNHNLNWGEAEDLDLSRRILAKGFMINFYKSAIVYTETNRHPGSKIKLTGYDSFKRFLNQFIEPIKKKRIYLKQYKGFRNFLRVSRKLLNDDAR